jgi:hypothetical protein
MEAHMGKIEHLQFLVLLIPSLVILAAAAVSMADLALPASEASPMMTVAVSGPIHSGELACEDNRAE